MPPPLRLPVQVRRADDLDLEVRRWESTVEIGGQEGRRAAQRLKELHRLEALFKLKPFFGRHVPQGQIPRIYKARGVTNLFRNDLPDGWRVLHTFVEADGVQAAILLGAMDHDEYDALFGYRGR